MRTSTLRRIYSINHPSEEVRAVAAAKCSRSPEPFDTILAGLTDTKAADFNEKWVLGYGHASVAEMAVPQYAIENVSILATKLIESLRRPSYQEKSTRYQKITRENVYAPHPDEVNGQGGTEAENLYWQIVDAAFDGYELLHAPMLEWAEKKVPVNQDGRASVVRNLIFDSLRYLLPCGTLTNLSVRINGRDLATLISLLRSHRFHEFKAIGNQLHTTASVELPTLLRHADASEWTNYLTEQYRHFFDGLCVPDLAHHANPGAKLVSYDSNAEVRVIAAMIYKASGLNGDHFPYDFCLQLASRNRDHWTEKLETIMAKRGIHDSAPEEFEATRYTFDTVMDYGAYRDMQRMRRCTQVPQDMDFRLGYSVPDGIQEAGLTDKYRRIMDEITKKLVFLDTRNEVLPKYATPLGFYHRSLHVYDLAQAYYVIELRSKPKGHISYRRIVTDMYNEIKRVHPLLATWIRCIPLDVIPLDAGPQLHRKEG